MTAFAAILLDDSVPTSVTFAPSAIDQQGVAKLFETGVSEFDARRAISLSVRLPKVGGSVARVTSKVVIPVMNGGSPNLKIGEVIGTCEFVIPKGATDLQRADILAFVKDFLDDPSMVAAVNNLESIY